MTDCIILSPALKRFLLYVRRSEIRGLDIDNPYMNVMTALTVPDIDDVTVVDFDSQEERIYWADIKTQTIKRVFINGTQLETVISSGWCLPVWHIKSFFEELLKTKLDGKVILQKLSWVTVINMKLHKKDLLIHIKNKYCCLFFFQIFGNWNVYKTPDEAYKVYCLCILLFNVFIVDRQKCILAFYSTV